LLSKPELYYPGNEERKNRADFDVIMTLEEFSNWSKENDNYIRSLIPRSANKYKATVTKIKVKKQYEIEIALEGTSSKFLLDNISEVSDGKINGFLDDTFDVLNFQYQILTKRSHLIYPVHFEKNITDYHLLKGLVRDFERTETMEKYYQLRFNEAKVRFNQHTPKLNVTTEDFFSSKLNVPNYFVHDHIHEVMAHYDRPIFTMMQRDNSKAWCEKDMFFNLPFNYQVQCVQEEAYVIALERYIIPQYSSDCNNFFECYKKAAKRICTTLTSGWFRSFAIENYDKVIDWYNPDFVNIFKTAVKNGEVYPLEGKNIKDVPLAI
jgi:hypothetical protein